MAISTQNLMRKQVNEKIARFSVLKGSLVPKQGWLRTLREALAMAAEQAAARAKVRRQVWLKVEEAEAKGTVSLNTLRKYAEAINCRVVYAVIPNDESLETMIRSRAREVAVQLMSRTNQTMSLENQSVSQAERERQISEIEDDLVRNLNSRLWGDFHGL